MYTKKLKQKYIPAASQTDRLPMADSRDLPVFFNFSVSSVERSSLSMIGVKHAVRIKGMMASIEKIRQEGWYPIVAVEENVDYKIIIEIKEKGIEIVSYKGMSKSDGMFKRYYLHPLIQKAECLFVRDADSIINEFE